MMTEDPILDAKLRGDQEKRRMVEDAGGTCAELPETACPPQTRYWSYG